jgi:hypothetical protein
MSKKGGIIIGPGVGPKTAAHLKKRQDDPKDSSGKRTGYKVSLSKPQLTTDPSWNKITQHKITFGYVPGGDPKKPRLAKKFTTHYWKQKTDK